MLIVKPYELPNINFDKNVKVEVALQCTDAEEFCLELEELLDEGDISPEACGSASWFRRVMIQSSCNNSQAEARFEGSPSKHFFRNFIPSSLS